jgi:hypothetical protein
MKTLRLPAILLAVCAAAFAQMPDKFTNLQVLPKDIPKKDLMSMMRTFSFSLGVRCEHCHKQSADKKIDFPADTENKQMARTMLRMVHAINQQYIDKLGVESPIPVQCVTCHRGLAEPEPINRVLLRTIEKHDVQTAITKYKELREKYYGGAAYDFTETPLNQLTEALLEQDRGKDAAAIMEMNVAMNTSASINLGWTQHLLAMSHEAAGDTEKAKSDLEKILARKPDDDWAKKELQRLEKK